MGAPERIAGPSGFERVTALPIERFMMGPAERVGAERFGAPQAAEYMSPYMQAVVESQKRAATQDYLRQLPGIGAAAARAGAKGGTREALLQSEARRSLAERMGDIEATGLQSAFQQAQQQFGADREAAMRAALANQAAGLTTGQQNLQAALTQQSLQAQQALEAQRLNQAAGLNLEQLRAEIAKANQAAGMTAEQANQQAALQVQQLGTQSGLQAALANQQMGMQVGQQNLAAEQARQQFMGQQGLQAALANQQAGMQVGQQNLQAQINQAQFAAQQAMQAGQLNQAAQLQAQAQQLQQMQALNQFNQQNAAQMAQYGLAGAQLGEQSRQFGANLGLQGLQQQLAAAGQLGGLGMQQYQQQMGIGQAQLGAGGQQQALQQELLNLQYQDFINKQQFPYQQLEFMSGILRGLPASGQSQSMYQRPGSLFGQIAGIGLGLGGLFGGSGGTGGTGGTAPSDRRLKSNVVRIGTHPLGIGVYEYDIWGLRQRGVMADEVMSVMPEAIEMHKDGYMAVRYDMIGGV